MKRSPGREARIREGVYDDEVALGHGASLLQPYKSKCLQQQQQQQASTQPGQ